MSRKWKIMPKGFGMQRLGSRSTWFQLAWLLSLQWLWEETSGLSVRVFQQADRSFGKAFNSTGRTSHQHKFSVCWPTNSRAVGSSHAAEHRLHAMPSPTRLSTCHVLGAPCEVEVCVPYHRDALWWRGGRCSEDAEVGDFQMKSFYTLIRSGLASLWILLLGNIFRFRAIICSAKNENIVNIISVASTQWVQNFNLSRYALHSWSSCMWRKRFRYSLGSSNWEGMGNMDS